MALIAGDLIQVPYLGLFIYPVVYVARKQIIYLIDMSDDWNNAESWGWIFPGDRFDESNITPQLEYLRGRPCRWIYMSDRPVYVGHID